MVMQNYKNPLDKFVGRDVWVKVYEVIKYGVGRVSNEYKIESWIRIVEATKDRYIVNILNDRRVTRSGFYSCNEAEKEKILSTSFGFPKSYFTLVEPLECLTTEEILGDYS